MAIRYDSELITGSANAVVTGTGVTSTQQEPKRIRAVWLHVTGYAGNRVLCYHEREEVLDIYDYLLQTDASTGSTNAQYVTTRPVRFELDINLPVGETFKAAIQCGSTNKNLYVTYEYEVGE